MQAAKLELFGYAFKYMRGEGKVDHKKEAECG